MTTHFVVVGIGADGWDGLPARSRDALSDGSVVYGSVRQLDLLPGDVAATRVPWRSPMSEHLAGLLESPDGGTIHVLASGDPMFHGVGASIVAAVGRDRVTVLPAPSSVSLAAAALGWDLASTRIVSAVTAPASVVVPELTDGARVLILSRGGETPAEVAELCRDHGFGDSAITVLANLGGPDETIRSGIAQTWDGPSDALNVIALDCAGPRVSRLPGLPDDTYENDGQLTKQTVRSLTVAALAPAEGLTLWDVGAGAGSIGIEWLRATDTGRVAAFEYHSDRTAAIRRNADVLGVGHRLTVFSRAPESFEDAPTPDVIFLGGGATRDVIERAWRALAPDGRIVANAVAIETQQIVIDARTYLGGSLTRLSVETAGPLGTLSAWRPALPIVQWVADKPATVGNQEDA